MVMLPKLEKDHTEPDCFRPILLHNVDIKPFASILAHRINSFLPSIIHRDQVGFISKRQASDNEKKKKIMHLTHVLRFWGIPGFLLSLDLQQVFYSTLWQYLSFELTRWCFSPFLAWLTALYALLLQRRSDIWVFVPLHFLLQVAQSKDSPFHPSYSHLPSNPWQYWYANMLWSVGLNWWGCTITSICLWITVYLL